MKKFALFLFFLNSLLLQAQNDSFNQYALEANYFYGNIYQHSLDLGHLTTGHPTGVILAWNRKTYGLEDWESRYNYPDVGYSFIYQDMKNENLGDNYGVYAHMGFYFLKRHLMFRVGQGIAYNTNPYHPDDNNSNIAYGTRLLSATYFQGNFSKQNILEGLGLQAGFALIHYSNADIKSPNTSTNSVVFNVGFNYLLDHEHEQNYVPGNSNDSYTEPVTLNFAIRGGINSTGVIGSPQLPFLTLTAYADKVLSHKSTLQGGTELFLSRSLEEFIAYKAAAFPQQENDPDADAKRIGVFAGHKLTFDKISLITHLGFYAYYPYKDFVNQVYNRVGLERKINEHLFGAVSLRSHGANAEAVEFSIGYRL